MTNYRFIKDVEGMIDPIDVGTIHFMQSYTKVIPKRVQYQMIKSGSKKNPYMGFVVEPYSFFLCYEILDLEAAKSLLPKGFTMIKTHIFDQDVAKYYAIFGCFNVHTSAFWGSRMEFYVIAQDDATGLLTWVIIDYDTNTVSFDEKNGLSSSTTKECILTTSYSGEVIIDIQGKSNQRNLILEADIKKGTTRSLDQRLWLEGNLSITYGSSLADAAKPFSVIFVSEEVDTALDIKNADVRIRENGWFNNMIEKSPSQCLCFPYAQHFMSDSPGFSSEIVNKEQLASKVENTDFASFPKYSSKPLKKSFQIGQVVSSSLIIILSILLLLK